jgi:hypothetical protein
MPRRRDQFAPQDAVAVFQLAPFWLGPVLAIVVYCAMRWIIPSLLIGKIEIAPVKPGEVPDLVGPVFRNGFGNASNFLAPWAATALMVFWAIAEITKWASRRAARNDSDRLEPSQSPAGAPQLCPKCDSAMVIKVARKGKNAGSRFWGCARWPECDGTRERKQQS